jgi:predicted Ser/Thr protein kinase
MLDPHSTDCPDENQLVMSLNGLLDTQERDKIEQHLDGCESCRSLIVQLLRATTLITDDSEPVEQAADAPLPRGTNLGRYVMLDCVGRGGSGLVYAAYDPELDRKVALKLLRTDLPGDPGAWRASLLREAQAMARLAHPNVISVFDVGTFQAQVFVAMEFIRGCSLGDWIREKPRSWRETVEVFLQAGEGLRAAHQSGLVHRDFKPDNVLVGDQGQVRVTDFGLARPTVAFEEPASRLPLSSGVTSHALAGTPLYMAPEQWGGHSADERTDQFSFCLSLYEALYGAFPYPGRTSASFTGQLPPAPKNTSVPAWLRRVLARGLSFSPEARYPAMQVLLNALARGLRAVRARVQLAAGLALAVLVGLAVDRTVQASAEREIEVDLARAAELFRVKAAEQQKSLDARAELTLKKEYLMEALGKADDLDTRLGLSHESKESGLAFAHELLRSADLAFLRSEDVLLLVDAEARVVYDQADESAYGPKLSGIDMLDRALAGESVEALWSPTKVESFAIRLATNNSEGDLLLILARPVTRGGKNLGALLLGRWAKASFLPTLEQLVGDRVVLQSPDGARSATMDWSLAAAKAAEEKRREVVKLGSTRYLVRSAKVVGFSGEVIGNASLVRNFDQPLQPILSRFRNDALRLVLAAAVLAIAAYFFWRVRSNRRDLRELR